MTNSSISRITFPTDLIQRIVLNLSLKEIAICLSVCKLWSHALNDSHEFWKHLCKRHFSLIDPLTSDYKQFYQQFHQIRSSLLIKPQPITLKGLKTYNLQITCSYTGKTGATPQFTPIAKIGEGHSIKNLYQKISQHPQKTEKWIGKIGEPIGALRNTDFYDHALVRWRLLCL